MVVDILRQTIMITSLVLVMMLLIEYFNVSSQGSFGKNLYHSRYKQIIISALLGLVPGCIGGFAVVSMFTHNLVNLGALVASMIASTGDESFVIISIMPKTALFLNCFLFVLAVLSGCVVNLFFKNFPIPYPGKTHMVIHHHEFEKSHHSWSNILENIRNISFIRAILIFGLLLFLFGIITGQFEHTIHNLSNIPAQSHSDWGLENILFAGLTVVALYILLLVDEHFLQEHLWEHIIHKHFLRIFLWTFGALIGIEILVHYVDFLPWLEKNKLIVMVLAILIGIIPESGPHLVFVTLYFSGALPLSILMTSSIVQDGHSSLPLLAESKKSFMLIKGMKIVLGIITGLTGYYMGW